MTNRATCCCSPLIARARAHYHFHFAAAVVAKRWVIFRGAAWPKDDRSPSLAWCWTRLSLIRRKRQRRAGLAYQGPSPVRKAQMRIIFLTHGSRFPFARPGPAASGRVPSLIATSAALVVGLGNLGKFCTYILLVAVWVLP